jgi:hypothetical protein
MKDNNMNGIGRFICKYGYICEGQFLNGQINGFGRIFYFDGDYYIGENKDG